MLQESDIKDSFKNDEAMELKAELISQDIKLGKYDVSQFVESLGFALTSSVIDMRVNGTRLLSSVVKFLPDNFLSEGQIKFITNFYCDRLKDHHNVYPCIIDGLLSIVQMENLYDGCVTQIYVSFFQNLACQSQVRTDREKIFKMIRVTSEKRTKELIKMGGDFLYGVINAIDGERDPKNLDYLYSFMPGFISSFPLLHLAEEMFEIFACYFPIDFNPSKTDPASITRDNLASSLCNCLVASEEFAEWAISLALEKLESDLVVAKLDSLELLTRSSQKFKIQSIETHFDKIWTGLKVEIFPGSDNEEVISKGLQTLKVILETASQDKDISKSLQTTVLGSILCHLNDTNHRMFAPSRSIALVCIAGDPHFATDKILDCLVLKLKMDDCDDEQKSKLLTAIAEVVTICSQKKCLKEINPDILKSLENILMKIFANEIQKNNLMKVLLNCLSQVFGTFSSENRIVIYKSLFDLLTNANLILDSNLKQIAQIFPNEVKEYFVEPIIKDFTKFSLETQKHLYLNLISLVDLTEIRSLILKLILDNILCSKSNEEKLAALQALRFVLEDQAIENKLITELLYEYDILEKISVFAKTNSDLPLKIFDQISIDLNIFVRKLSLDDQKNVLDKYLPKMKLNQTADLFLTKGILGFMHESVSTDMYFDNLLEDLTTLSLENDDPVVCNACHHLICTLLNKSEDNESNRSSLKRILHKLKIEIEKENEKAVKVLSWIAKGLAIRGHSEAADIIEDLTELLNHPSLSNAACLAFEIISVEYPQLHLPVVKYLFKQKLFHIVLNKIGKYLLGYSENHLNAFIFILKMVPQKVLKINIEKVGPILFKCLEMEKTSTILIALEISERFLEEKDDYFRGHFNYLISQYLKLSEFQNSMNVRVYSLKCIEAIAKYPTYVVLPYKMDVVFNLANALDDKKRLVRNAAVKARNLWFLIGSTTPE